MGESQTRKRVKGKFWQEGRCIPILKLLTSNAMHHVSRYVKFEIISTNFINSMRCKSYISIFWYPVRRKIHNSVNNIFFIPFVWKSECYQFLFQIKNNKTRGISSNKAGEKRRRKRHGECWSRKRRATGFYSFFYDAIWPRCNTPEKN